MPRRFSITPAPLGSPARRPVLEGRAPGDWRTSFFYEYFRERNFGAPTVLAVRTTTHKLSTYPGHRDWTEVFNLRADPYETKNLAPADPALVAKLQAQMDQLSKASGFRWPAGYSADGDTAAPATTEKAAKKKKK
jgi:hypothetical protein